MNSWVEVLVHQVGKIKGRGFEDTLGSAKVKNFSFGMFNNEAKTIK